MAIWPFGKKNKNKNNFSETTSAEETAAPESATSEGTAPETVAPQSTETTSVATDADATDVDTTDADTAAKVQVGDAEVGPFDGDSVDIEEFDFSDFSSGILDLGSMKIALPKQSQVQVEMGENGPKMLHIVTHHGRLTPVAFAAPRSAGQWETASQEIAEGMTKDGVHATFEDGPWGKEVVSDNNKAGIRVIGVDGPRWMLRMTMAGPTARAEELAQLGRQVVARTFVYRGEQAILAGNSLPVQMPANLASQVEKAMQQRQQNQDANSSTQASSEQTDRAAEAMRQARDNSNKEN